MGIVEKALTWAAARAGMTLVGRHRSEQGRRPTPDKSIEYLYRQMWVDPDLRQTIMDIRDMDHKDGRVKRIHAKIARDTIKGGLVFTQNTENKALRRKWDDFQRRLQLNRQEKLKSDVLGLVKEGNLPLQIVTDEAMNLCAAVRMPTETILPKVGENGMFLNPAEAYWQIDPYRGEKIAGFALWQLYLARFDPDNFDDLGSMGRPFLDASRATWRKLAMTEEDLVIRRRTRAPLRLSHVLEGATKEELAAYKADVEGEKHEITTDFYANRKGGVTAVAGDAKLAEIGDVVHLMDTFFAGGPIPKGLMGYTEGMARDILEDMKRDYYDEVDGIQDNVAFAYDWMFRLELLFDGINPEADEFSVSFAERRTETLTQTTDRMLKYQALGFPGDMIYEEMGYNAQDVAKRKDEAAKRRDPYPDPTAIGNPPTPRVSVTPGNGRKGESATDITVR